MHHAQQHIARERLHQRAADTAALGHGGPAAVNQTRERGRGTDGAAVAGRSRGGHQRRPEGAQSHPVAADHREDRRRPAKIHLRLHSLPQRPAQRQY